MELSFKLEVNSSAKKIWENYSNVENWLFWDCNLDRVSLDGLFINDSHGEMQMKGMPPLHFTLSQVVENQEFWNHSSTPMGKVNFGHKIIKLDKTMYIEHIVSLETEKNDKESLTILESIFSNVPTSMLKLKELVEKND